MENPKDKNKNDDKDCENKINLNDNNDENKEKNNEDDEYNFLKDNKILGRFTFSQKLYIINKLNVIVYNRIKKELMIELKRKRLENKILMIKSRIKTKLILQKKMQSLVQQKMIRDFNFKKKLKDLRKKLMDEKIEKLKYKNLVFLMKAYGIYREDNFCR
jgi:hypothetical protein